MLILLNGVLFFIFYFIYEIDVPAHFISGVDTIFSRESLEPTLTPIFGTAALYAGS